MDARRVLTDGFPTDVHTAGYLCPSVAHRLNKDALKDPSLHGDAAPKMAWLIIDVDCTEAHRGGSIDAGWRERERERVARLLAEHPGAFVYETRGGYRIIYRIEPQPCGPSWTRLYDAILRYLAERFDIHGDPACSDWTHLFRVPHATRDGSAPENLPVFGDAANIGLWTWRPGPDDARDEPARADDVGVPTGKPNVLEHEFEKRGLIIARRADGKTIVRCPWEKDHSTPSRGAADTSVAVLPPTTTAPLGRFVCFHGHKKRTRDVVQAWGLSLADLLRLELVARAPVNLLQPERAAEAIRGVLDEALRTRGSVTLVKVTTGGGKSTQVLRLVNERDDALLSIPTHKLGDQYDEQLLRDGINATRRIGIGAARERRGCEYPGAVERLGRLGIPGRFMCGKCALKDTCEAHQDSGRKAATGVEIVVHALFHKAVVGLAPDTNALVVIDEPPPLTVTVRWRVPSRVRDPRTQALAQPARSPFRKLVFAFEKGLRLVRASGAQSWSLREVLAAAAAKDADGLLAAVAALRAVGWDMAWAMRVADQFRAEEEAADLGFGGRERDRSGDDDMVILLALWSAATFPDHPCVFLNDDGQVVVVARGPWVLAVRHLVLAGFPVIVLDATGDRAAMAAALGCDVVERRIDIADTGHWVRLLQFWSNAPRKRCLEHGEVQGRFVTPQLRRIAGSVQARGSTRLALFTYLPIAEPIRAWLDGRADAPGWLPPEFMALRHSGIAISVAHFGALRGLDAWKGCDHFVVLGDPRPNLDDATHEALALGMAQSTYPETLAVAELEQAIGRARTPHNEHGGVIEVYGTLAPSTPQWAGVECFTSVDSYDPVEVTGDQLRAWREAAKLSKRAAAKLAGVTDVTWGNWESRGADTPPPGTTSRIVEALGGGDHSGVEPDRLQSAYVRSADHKVSSLHLPAFLATLSEARLERARERWARSGAPDDLVLKCLCAVIDHWAIAAATYVGHGNSCRDAGEDSSATRAWDQARGAEAARSGFAEELFHFEELLRLAG